MNRWTKLSIDYANQRSYLDDLFQVYPTIPDGIRDLDASKWSRVEDAFVKQDNIELIKSLLLLDLFPIKDSYIAYFKRDLTAIGRNPKTVNRVCGRLYEMGLNKIYERCSEPKETNRQISPMFRGWLLRKSLGIEPVEFDEFVSSRDDAILGGGDNVLSRFAEEYLGYDNRKGLDFVARFNGKYVVGEAKFLTDFGGHQNAQFNDAINLVKAQDVNAIKVAILDGVLYIKGNNKMYKSLEYYYADYNIMSALVLREFLYQV